MLTAIAERFSPDLALDLGTANTRIGVPRDGVVLSEPSVVAVERATRRIVAGGRAVGHLARHMEGRTPDSLCVLRPLNRGVVTDYELCEAMLRVFLRKARRSAMALKPRVLATMPSSVTPVERRALSTTAERAGARRVILLKSVKAAAVGVGLPVAEPTANLICVIGSGTTEIAVMSLGEVVAGASLSCGGDRFDDVVAEHVRRIHELRVGPSAAEELRREIGSAWPIGEPRTAEIRGVDVKNGQPRKAEVRCDEVRSALAGPLEEIAHAIQSTIDQCGPELAADLVDAGGVIAGGGALVVGIAEWLTHRLGLPIRVPRDPEGAVVRGALICLEEPARWQAVWETDDDGR
jgi:rod shape-determining protein MreB